jgi:hypothetical protein
MLRSSLVIASLSVLASSAAAEHLLLSGHVQRVILQPPGVGDCPPRCVRPRDIPEGHEWVCISNLGGCETMEIKVDKVFLGSADGPLHTFKKRIGEWGPRFSPVEGRVVVSQEFTDVITWSPATDQDGKTYIDPKRLHSIAGVPTSGLPANQGKLVAIEDLLERLRTDNGAHAGN